MNRIHDSLQLWSSICSNRLLKRATLILLLNKARLFPCFRLLCGVVATRLTAYVNRPTYCGKSSRPGSKSASCTSSFLRPTRVLLALGAASAHTRVRSITSYAERPNTYEEVATYFKAHFEHAHKRNDDARRRLFAVRFLPCHRVLCARLIVLGRARVAIHVDVEHQGVARDHHRRCVASLTRAISCANADGSRQ